MQPTVIGLDPATHCGYATPDQSGQWDLSPAVAAKSKGRAAEPEWSRCGKLASHLQTLAAMYKNEKVVVFCESASGFTRFPHTLKIGHELRGVIKASCHAHKWKYVEVPATTLKKWATGSGKAKKPEMIEAAKAYVPTVSTDDEADAILLRQFGLASLQEI